MIKGSFVFRDEGDGCLTSKYVNTRSMPFVEAAKLRGNVSEKGRFYGVYDTVWLETDGTSITHTRALLTITRDALGNYELKWQTDVNSPPFFEGIGMLFENLLVGGYWSTS